MPCNIEIKAKVNPEGGMEDAEMKALSLALDGKIHEHLQQVDVFFNVPNGRMKLRTENDRSVLITYFRSNIQGPKKSQ